MIVSTCVPAESFGSGTLIARNARLVSPRSWRSRVSESTENVTWLSGPSADPNPRTWIVGRSDARYSGAIEASTKNGSPTGIMIVAPPACRSPPTADALTCQDVRSAGSGMATDARPSASVSMAWKRIWSLTGASPPPPVSPPSESDEGRWCVA